MSDRMRVIPFDSLVKWIFAEYEGEKTIFGIAEKHFFKENTETHVTFCSERLSSSLGPAAGPHTQLAQNLAAAYLTGGRFFELKTVQVLDRLSFPKPCINAEDECYNTEWSTELSIEEAFAEYVKGWFLVHVLAKEFFQIDQRSFIFNMSVGYDLEGIESEKVAQFIEGLKDASSTAIFKECKAVLNKEINRFKHIDKSYIDSISSAICNSIALSTMHGCPPPEIEAICKYMLLEKQLHTFVKLNPTLLGYEYVRKTLDKMGYSFIKLMENSFAEDLRYEDGVPMLERLVALAGECKREFGVKLSNTLPVRIAREELAGEQMYMSGKPLYALTINLAYKLAAEFKGKLKISYSGGADRNNVVKIVETGIQPVTVVTTLLKPNGYQRLKQLADLVEQESKREFSGIDLGKLYKLATEAVEEPAYHKKSKTEDTGKVSGQLPLFDCRASCTICTAVCPNRANVRVKVEDSGLKYDHQILHLDGMCYECGNCATFCPDQGIPYRDKLTLFWFEEDFADSENNGFILLGERPEEKLKIRFKGEIVELSLNSKEEEAAANVDPVLLSVIRRVCSNYQYFFYQGGFVMEESIKWIANSNARKKGSKPWTGLDYLGETAVKNTRKFIRSFPQYETTPLRNLSNLAEYTGVSGIYVKDESYRFGLNSFKVLGGGHAIGRYLSQRLEADPAEFSYAKLKSDETRQKLGEITFTSATDGNHGRGVAWAARQLGHRAVINMPKGSSLIRLEHITATGAKGYITDVNYDETVRLTADNARKHGWVVIQDTAWEGYEDIPTWVMQGYTVMVDEALEQLNKLGIDSPTHIFIQAGVGSLAAAVLGYFASKFHDQRPVTVVVEPNKADCFYRSALAGDGRPRNVTGAMDTIMAGLACGEPNPFAWNILWNMAEMFISCPDYIAANGMRILGNPLSSDIRIISGESGAVTTGMLFELLCNENLKEARDRLSLDQNAKILIFSTEGDTDPEMYRKIVWDGEFSAS